MLRGVEEAMSSCQGCKSKSERDRKGDGPGGWQVGAIVSNLTRAC